MGTKVLKFNDSMICFYRLLKKAESSKETHAHAAHDQL